MSKIIGQRNGEEGETRISDMTKLCVRYGREVMGIKTTEDEVWKPTPNGELYPFFFTYAAAIEHYAPSRGRWIIDDYYQGSGIICYDNKWEFIGYGKVTEIDKQKEIDDVATTAIVRMERSGEIRKQDLHFAYVEYSHFWIIENISDDPYILSDNALSVGKEYLEPFLVIEEATRLSKESPDNEFTIVSWSSLDDSIQASEMELYRGQVFKNGFGIREKHGYA